MLQFITSGESHNKYLIALLEGMPSGLRINVQDINKDLKRRQQGYGRGPRMAIESDTIEITSGVYKGRTTGAPIGLMITNREVRLAELPQLERPRPGHADFAGSLKYDQGIREVLERASARETALRVAIGGVCKQLLQQFDINIISHVCQIGVARIPRKMMSYKDVKRAIKGSTLNCAVPAIEKKMISEIKKAQTKQDTIGGEFEVVASGVPIGIGSYVHHARKLDALLAAGLMSVQAIKAVQFGCGVEYAQIMGSAAHDELFYSAKKGYYRKTNYAGGIEGGMSNGCDIIVRATMKPIATLKKPLRSVNMRTRKSQVANFERSDICAVPACSVIGEAIVAYEIASAFCDKFGGDSLREVTRNFKGYRKQINMKH